MLTPQDINDKSFDKVMLNGYDTGEVDDFLDAVSNDYNALYKENAILKGKLKVLVEKVEEYRSTEDAMRMALLTAQRMGEEITNEANRAKDEMLLKADADVKAALNDTAKRVAEEEMRLSVAAKETAKFIELSQAIMRKHSEFLEKLEAARRAVSPKGEPKQAAGQAKTGRAAKPAPQGKTGQQVRPQGALQPEPAPQQTAPEAPPPPPPPAPPAPQAMPPQNVPSQDTKPIPAAPQQSVEIDDIASHIGAVVEQLSDDELAAPPEVEEAALSEPPPSFFEDDDGSVKFYSHEEDSLEEEATTPRPKFDFDDLKFGANFDSDE